MKNGNFGERVSLFQSHEKPVGECLNKIKRSKVMIAGLGRLGLTVSELLIRIGFKDLFLVGCEQAGDPDLDQLYTQNGIGKLRSDVSIVKINRRIDESFSLPSADIVVDCLNSFKARYILEERAFKKKIPIVHGGVKGYTGQITVIYPHKTKRLKDIFGDMEDEPQPSQVFPPIVTLVGSIQASEVVKLVCGDEDGSLINRLLVLDLSINSFDLIYLG